MLSTNLKDPEKIAETYGGDKQKIMQAAQMGVVDPTVAVMAGMFIDRMRAPAATEGKTPPTVAQQVFAPPGAPPPGAPPPGGPPPGGPPPGGPGGPPPMGAEGPPPGPMGPPPPMGAGGPPPGVAMGAGGGAVTEGGLAGLPVPDSLYDDAYAGGGIVAFSGADGSTVGGDQFDLAGNFEKQYGLGIQPPAPPPVAPPAAAPPPAAPAGPPPVGVAEYMQRVRDIQAAGPEQFSGVTDKLFGGLSDEAQQAALKHMKEQASEEEYKKGRKQDIWTEVAKAGAMIASTPGPILSLAAKALSDVAVGGAASKKERTAARTAAIKGWMEAEDISRKKATEKFNIWKSMYDSSLTLEQNMAQVAQKREEAIAQNETTMAAAQLRADTDIKTTGMTVAASRDNARTAANAAGKPTDFDKRMRILQFGTPEEKAALQYVEDTGRAVDPNALYRIDLNNNRRPDVEEGGAIAARAQQAADLARSGRTVPGADVIDFNKRQQAK